MRSDGTDLWQALRDPVAAQEALLLRILAENAQTEFGRAHGFERVSSLSEYREAVPPVDFEALAPLVERTLAGERDVLIAGAPAFFGRTSGTVGLPKCIPYPPSVEQEYQGALAPLLEALERHAPGSTSCAMNLTGSYLEDRSPGGVPIGSASGFVRHLSAYRGHPYFQFAPEAVMEMRDFEGRYYAMLRFALAKDLRLLAALNPSTLLTMFGRAVEWGEALAEDLALGTMRRGPASATSIEPGVQAELRPDVAAAQRLRASLARHGRFVPGEVWPSLRVVQTWKGGAASHYLAALREACPGSSIWSLVSGSTEGLLLVPLAPEWSGGVPALASSVLEFFAESDPPAGQAFVPLAELAEGRGYRVALTNRRGMYRLRMDDVFVLEGRYQGVPVLRFSHRHGLVSSLTGEKVTEGQVIAAAERALAGRRLSITDYQAAAEWGDPPHYALLVELGADAPEALLGEFLSDFERGLCAENVEYAAKRRSGRLSPARLLVVAPGTFEGWRKERASQRQGSDAQTKLPRLRREALSRDDLGPVRELSA